jgi:hypothetical protein
VGFKEGIIVGFREGIVVGVFDSGRAINKSPIGICAILCARQLVKHISCM